MDKHKPYTAKEKNCIAIAEEKSTSKKAKN